MDVFLIYYPTSTNSSGKQFLIIILLLKLLLFVVCGLLGGQHEAEVRQRHQKILQQWRSRGEVRRKFFNFYYYIHLQKQYNMTNFGLNYRKAHCFLLLSTRFQLYLWKRLTVMYLITWHDKFLFSFFSIFSLKNLSVVTQNLSLFSGYVRKIFRLSQEGSGWRRKRFSDYWDLHWTLNNPIAVCRIPGFGNSSTIEWLDASMRAFSDYGDLRWTTLVVCRIPGFGYSSTVEWLDPSARTFSDYWGLRWTTLVVCRIPRLGNSSTVEWLDASMRAFSDYWDLHWTALIVCRIPGLGNSSTVGWLDPSMHAFSDYWDLHWTALVVCRIPGFGNSSTVEWLDPSMRAFSGYFANIADHLGNTGCLTIRCIRIRRQKSTNFGFLKPQMQREGHGTADKQWLAAVPCPPLRSCGWAKSSHKWQTYKFPIWKITDNKWKQFIVNFWFCLKVNEDPNKAFILDSHWAFISNYLQCVKAWIWFRICNHRIAQIRKIWMWIQNTVFLLKLIFYQVVLQSGCVHCTWQVFSCINHYVFGEKAFHSERLFTACLCEPPCGIHSVADGYVRGINIHGAPYDFRGTIVSQQFLKPYFLWNFLHFKSIYTFYKIK